MTTLTGVPFVFMQYGRPLGPLPSPIPEGAEERLEALVAAGAQFFLETIQRGNTQISVYTVTDRSNEEIAGKIATWTIGEVTLEEAKRIEKTVHCLINEAFTNCFPGRVETAGTYEGGHERHNV
jgi:hypothetical protein